MKKIAQAVCLSAIMFLAQGAKAQMSGSYGVPGTFATIAAAINSLNLVGVSGSVSIDIAAGYTETAPTGGYSLTATGTALNPITFQKVGVGANPLITAYTGTATPAQATQDGVWRLIGSDYITIDGIDIVDPNTSNPATMEFGYGLFKASVTDGCQHNTIQNCVITLNRINNAAGSGPSLEGSKGINVINALVNTNITNVTPTSASGSNSFNRFYSNTIQNCNTGIAITGYAAPTPYTLSDFGNDVGGSSPSTGNTIINFGGGGTGAATGISTLQQRDFNASYNFIHSNNGGGVDHAGIARGIYINTAAGANASVNNNTVTLKVGGTTSAVSAIQNAAGSTASNNTITMSHNLITDCTYTTATSGAFNAILNGGTPEFLVINNNIVINNILSGTGIFTGINGAGAAAVTISMNSNTVTGNIKSGASGTMYCMRAGTSSVTVNGNFISNNSIPNTSGATSSSIYGYYNIGAPTFEVYTNNTIQNLSISGAGTSTAHQAYGIYTNSSSSSFKTISGNVIGSLSIASTLAGGNMYGIYQSLANTVDFSKNKIYDLSVGGALGNAYGVYVNSGTNISLSNNIIGNLSTPASDAALAIAGIFINNATNLDILYNTVHLNAVSTGTAFGTTALYTSSTPVLTLRNNILNNLSTPTGTGVVTALRSNSVNLVSYNVTSNNNCFYAGTPGASNLIFSDGGVNLVPTLAIFQGAVTPREVNSITENTPFLSLVGSNANFLHIDPSLPSLTESGAVNISGIADDFDGDIRQGNGGYAGNGTAPDIGADEYNQTLPVCSGVSAATISALSLTSCFSETISAYSTGYSSGTGIVHQWQYSTSQGGPYVNVPVGPTSNHHAYSTSSFSAGVYYLVMVSTCSVGPVSATSNELSFTVNVSPSASITAQSLVCQESDINLIGGTDIGNSFLWTGPNSFTSAAQNPTITNATTDATGQYSFVTTGNGCSSPVAVFSLSVSGSTLAIISSDPVLCLGNTLTLTANTSASTYTWINNSVQNSSIAVAPIVTTIYTVQSTNSDNCNLVRTHTVSVIDVTIAAVSASACSSTTGTLTANTLTNAVVNWYASPTSTTSLGTGTAFTLTALTNTTVYAESNSQIVDSLFTTATGSSAFMGEMFDVVALNGIVINGFDVQLAAGSGTIEIWYRPGTHVGFETSNTGWTLVSSTSLTSNGVGVVTPITSSLSIPIGVGQTAAFYVVANTGPNVRYSPGTLLGSVLAANSDLQILEGSTGNTYFGVNTTPRAFNGTVRYSIPGCPSPRVPATLSVSPSPVVTVAQSAASVCFSTQATFTASGANTYSWVNGPSTNIFSTFPTSAAVYTVEGTSNTTGCSSTATVAIGINPLPVISISPSSATVCESSLVSYTATGATTYTWSDNTVGDNLASNPTVSQTYTVVGTDNLGCVASETVDVVVNPLPIITISPLSATVCESSAVSFTAAGATTYTWSDNTQGDIINDNPTLSQTYTVTGTSNFGCVASETVAVVTNTLPIVSIAPASASVCENAVASFTASGAATYTWNTTLVGDVFSLTAVTSSVYTVEGATNEGCTSTSTVALTTFSNPVVNVSPTSATVCQNSAATFTATGASTYSWNTNATTATLSVVPNSNTTYTVTGVSSDGCEATANVAVQVNALPTVLASAANATICVGESAVLTASGAVNYAWEPATGSTASISVSPTVTTSYSVTGTDANNCVNIAIVSLVVDACTGINERTFSASKINVYPNPTSGLVNIDFNVEGEKTITVTNSIGAVVAQLNTESSSLNVDLSAQAKGIYFVNVNVAGTNNRVKILVQ